jgi:hypothetical protein
MFGFDLEKLLDDSSRVVVWMKARCGTRAHLSCLQLILLHSQDQRGQTMYIDANPQVARSCYAAGNALYFNPSMEMQVRRLLYRSS